MTHSPEFLLRRQQFLDGLARASAEIETWPEWKKDASCLHVEQESEEAFQERKAAIRAYGYWPG